jgi:putative ABC transport system permease protein
MPLVWSGIWRRRGRAALMLLQIVCAFALFGVLQGVNSGVKEAIASTHGERLYITSRVSVGDLLPIGILQRIRATPGIRAVTARRVLIGTYMKLDQVVPIICVDAEPFFHIYHELSVSPLGAVQTLQSTRTGAIIGGELVKRYGWKVGDRVVLQSSVAKRNGSHAWEFDVVGVYDEQTQAFGVPPPFAIVANFNYVNGARATDVDGADMYLATVGNAGQAASVGLAIDNAFANSDHETHTQSEGDLMTTQLQKTVDLGFIVHGIVAAVFFALLLATGALMMQSLHERTAEFAVLKTIGFSDRHILLLILAESIVFCLLAAGVGLAVGAVLLPLARALVGFASMPAIVVIGGLGCALLLALIAGATPALRGSRLQIVEALADR